MAYFLRTLLFTMLVALLILPIFFGIVIAAFLPRYMCVPILLILCFWVMYEYGYWFTEQKQSRKPLSRLGIYVPVFLPLV